MAWFIQNGSKQVNQNILKRDPDNTLPDTMVDLGPVIKAPLDSKNYKMIELPNGLRVMMVSTCQHKINLPSESNPPSTSSDNPPSPPSTNSFALQKEIDKFNNTFLGPPLGVACPTGAKCTGDSNGTKPGPYPPAKVPKLVRCCKGPATICVTVGAGAFHDPRDTQGLAHLVEHLIFLGSKQHPEANKLFTRVFENGGVVNATTFAEYTCYYFSCASTGFEECVEILVDALTSPLFRQSDISREIEVIDSEFGIKQTDDLTRISDFLRTRAKRGHPFGNFYWGNKNTLDYSDIRFRVQHWKQQYYLANYMTVCIQAPMPLQKMEKFVVDEFSDIPRAPADAVHPTQQLLKHGPPFSPEVFNTTYLIAPVGHLTCVVISWALDPSYWRNYETKPLEYLRIFLENTAPGGLRHYLRDKQWMTEWINLYVDCSVVDDLYSNSYCSMFNLLIHLTDKGYTEMSEVLKAVFSYIKMLQRGGVRPAIFEEMRRSASAKFHFHNWDEMAQNGIDIAVNMRHGVPPENILTAKALLTKWDAKLISKCAQELTPRKAIFCMAAIKNRTISKAWPSGIRFQEHKPEEEFYLMLEGVGIYPEFRLPTEGTFLAKEITLVKGGGWEEMEKIKGLGLLHVSDKLQVEHFKTLMSPCLCPRLPSAYYAVYFSSHLVSGHGSRMKQGVLEYWSRIIMDRIIEQAGHQFDNLFSFGVGINEDGLSVHLGGPRCYLLELLTLALRQVFDCDGLECRGVGGMYENLKLDLVRQYQNDTFDVDTLSKDILAYLREEKHASLFEIKNELEDVSVGRDFERMVQKFRRRMHVTVELYGAVTPEDAQNIIQLLEGGTKEMIFYKGPAILPDNMDRGTLLPLGCSNCVVKAVHPAYVTSVVTNFYQVDQWKGENGQNLLLMVYQLLKRRFSDQLRSKEQLGYTVRVTPHFSKERRDSTGISVTVLSQPEKWSTMHVDARIDAYFRQFWQYGLKREEMKEYICTKFEVEREEVAELERFYRDNFLRNGENFRKLSIQVQGYLPKARVSARQKENVLLGKGNKAEVDDFDYGSFESVIQLEYLKLKEGQGKQQLEKEIGRVIQNVAKFKRELCLLPVTKS